MNKDFEFGSEFNYLPEEKIRMRLYEYYFNEEKKEKALNLLHKLKNKESVNLHINLLKETNPDKKNNE